jgi:hypothetical protein
MLHASGDARFNPAIRRKRHGLEDHMNATRRFRRWTLFGDAFSSPIFTKLSQSGYKRAIHSRALFPLDIGRALRADAPRSKSGETNEPEHFRVGSITEPESADV